MTSGQPYRVLVTGSRDWEAEGTLRQALNAAYRRARDAGCDRLVVVHGACPSGADAMAETWIRDYEQTAPVDRERHPARWVRPGSGHRDLSAGPRRNAEMVKAGADECLAFIRNGSDGATGCADLAEQAGIPTRRFTDPAVVHGYRSAHSGSFGLIVHCRCGRAFRDDGDPSPWAEHAAEHGVSE